MKTRRPLLAFSLAFLLATMCLGGTLPAAAQDEPPVPTDVTVYNPWVQLFPALRRLPAPDWVGEGLRATYYVQTALVGGDPDVTGSSGAVLLQYDLVALDRRNALFSTTMYLENGAGGMTPNLVVGSRTIPAAGEYYLNPAVLVGAEAVANDELTVLSMPTTIGDQEYQAKRFQYETAKATHVWMYDEVTGILLFYRHEIDTADGQQLTDMTLVGARALAIPWLDGDAPEWATRGWSFRMEGSLETAVAGASAVSIPQSVEGRIMRAGARWTEYSVDSGAGSLNAASLVRASGGSQLKDALWLPAEALTIRSRRRVLDTDPVTGAEVIFARRSNSVEISETGNGWSTVWSYNTRSGMLQDFSQQTQVGLATLTLSMETVASGND